MRLSCLLLLNAFILNILNILLAEHRVDKVFEVVRICDRIILLRLVIGKVVFTLLSVYTPQSGLPEAVKERFYDQLQSTVTKVPATDIPILVGDWNRACK